MEPPSTQIKTIRRHLRRLGLPPGGELHMSAPMRATIFALVLCAAACGPEAPASTLDRVVQRGFVRVGTTGNAYPFTWLNPKTNHYEGYDVDAARNLAAELGIRIKWIATDFETMVRDLRADRFDIAMGGINGNLERAKLVGVSNAYLVVTRTPVVRARDRDMLSSFEKVDQPGVTVGVSPGGTKENFARVIFQKAQVVTIPKGPEMPQELVEGNVDVLIMDDLEARTLTARFPTLTPVESDNPLFRVTLNYLTPRDDFLFRDWVDLWIDIMTLRGEFKNLESKWIVSKQGDKSDRNGIDTKMNP